MIPKPPRTVEIIVAMVLMESTFTPFAFAKFGLDPAAFIMRPKWLFINSFTRIQNTAITRINPTGISISPIENAQSLLSARSYHSSRVIVVRSPSPIGHTMDALLNGSTSQPIHINATTEKPT